MSGERILFPSSTSDAPALGEQGNPLRSNGTTGSSNVAPLQQRQTSSTLSNSAHNHTSNVIMHTYSHYNHPQLQVNPSVYHPPNVPPPYPLSNQIAHESSQFQQATPVQLGYQPQGYAVSPDEMQHMRERTMSIHSTTSTSSSVGSTSSHLPYAIPPYRFGLEALSPAHPYVHQEANPYHTFDFDNSPTFSYPIPSTNLNRRPSQQDLLLAEMFPPEPCNLPNVGVYPAFGMQVPPQPLIHPSSRPITIPTLSANYTLANQYNQPRYEFPAQYLRNDNYNTIPFAQTVLPLSSQQIPRYAPPPGPPPQRFEAFTASLPTVASSSLPFLSTDPISIPPRSRTSASSRSYGSSSSSKKKLVGSSQSESGSRTPWPSKYMDEILTPQDKKMEAAKRRRIYINSLELQCNEIQGLLEQHGLLSPPRPRSEPFSLTPAEEGAIERKRRDSEPKVKKKKSKSNSVSIAEATTSGTSGNGMEGSLDASVEVENGEPGNPLLGRRPFNNSQVPIVKLQQEYELLRKRLTNLNEAANVKTPEPESEPAVPVVVPKGMSAHPFAKAVIH